MQNLNVLPSDLGYDSANQMTLISTAKRFLVGDQDQQKFAPRSSIPSHDSDLQSTGQEAQKSCIQVSTRQASLPHRLALISVPHEVRYMISFDLCDNL